MSEYPRYDLTQPAKDPNDMSDEELDWTVAVLKEDLDDARKMADSLKEDIKKRRGLWKVYRSFREIREEGRMPVVPRQPAWFSWDIPNRWVPWLSPGVFDMGIFGQIVVHPEPPQRYQQRWFRDIASWAFGRGDYRH
ncbi:hypothetical protein ES703_41389 [subsurface metagenome]